MNMEEWWANVVAETTARLAWVVVMCIQYLPILGLGCFFLGEKRKEEREQAKREQQQAETQNAPTIQKDSHGA